MAKVTVVIPFFNRKDLLPKALDSVFRQTYQDWKIVLVDDGSTDDYFPVIAKYVADSRVRLIRNRKNAGQSHSLNAALAVVDTPFMVQLDSDDWFFPDTLELLVNEAKLLPRDVGVISGNLNVVWEDKAGNTIRQKVKKGRPFHDRYEFLLANTNIVPRFYRTAALKKVGGWPTDVPYKGRYREDMLILYKLIERYRFHWIDKPLYNQRVHRSNLTHGRKMLQETAEWSVRAALKRWGGDYKAKFFVTRDGWKKVGGLTVADRLGKKKMFVNPLAAEKMEKLIKDALKKKTSLCLASLANVTAAEELKLLDRSNFWRMLEKKKIVLLSSRAKSVSVRIRSLCRMHRITFTDCIAIDEKTSGKELAKRLKSLKYDVVLVSSDFNAVDLCRKLLKKQEGDKIIVDVKDGLLKVRK